MLPRVVWLKFTDVSEVFSASSIREMIALMMETASTSETSVDIYQTALCNIPENSHLHTRRRKKLKSHHDCIIFGLRVVLRSFVSCVYLLTIS
jgi:hypothetical protein